MAEQVFIQPTGQAFHKVLRLENVKRIFLVCGKSFLNQKLYNKLLVSLGFEIKVFTDFEPNPKYESIVRGIKEFRKSETNFIIAAGGGSAIDVAKCIQYYNSCDTDVYLLNQVVEEKGPALLAIPTTAGTGSESTEFAAIYVDGIKHSVSNGSILPKYVCLDSSLLDTLPINQRKVTMLDALCHSIEAFWSINSTEESKSYSRRAIKAILENYQGYLNNDDQSNLAMLDAANLAGRAINIAKTTACHAMSYILTSHYGTPHGFAASIFILPVWKFIKENLERCSDTRGTDYLISTMEELEKLITCEDFDKILGNLALKKPILKNETTYEIALRVNEARLKNTPVRMYKEDIEKIYIEVLN